MKQITTSELCRMTGIQGLILQGCGGEAQEWLDGINGILTDEGILRNGDKFKEVSSFEHNGHTDLLFHMDGVDLDVGRLAIWRLATHNSFAGVWLSDFVTNHLGGFVQGSQVQEKPDCPLIGRDGNVFNLMGIVSQTLKQHGLGEQAKEMCSKITACGSYDEALCIMGDYVNITSAEDAPCYGGMSMG